ncbi:MAG TPA: superoxide dismutase [bacterium]|nr:superoxide dismutase [bacterium]
MNKTLPKLNYNYDSLEPFIDAKTVEIHYSKHHQNYLNKLVEALDKHPELSEVPLENILSDLDIVPEDIRTAVKNNGGGHFNHSFYWSIMNPNTKKIPSDEFLSKIGDFEKFKKDFTDKALGLFGSGWVWLVLNEHGDLEILQTSNQDCPLSMGKKPLLPIDLWEHAYYLKYQNRRSEYIEAWWNLVDWEVVEKIFEKYNSR